jgi:hypothetical protein
MWIRPVVSKLASGADAGSFGAAEDPGSSQLLTKAAAEKRAMYRKRIGIVDKGDS